ncbi:WD repeat-containing protein 34-like protein [Dinothrombium tinctorium]|uniref:WD repeat-containing protein 34-like protein n=1 Tax=Dinothrombium tinctorium TaxID=1965070 RepID=A0A3S3PDS4_9ACAR|nr:WD repeat-containing protein 34-like protein [Dinothrombium tinctorium]
MFGLSSQQTASVNSSWREAKHSVSNVAQTDQIDLKDEGIQFPKTAQSSTQTLAVKEEQQLQESTAEYDSTKLNQFLNRVVPLVEREIEKSVRFRNLWEKTLKFWQNDENRVRTLRTFYSNHILQLVNDSHESSQYTISMATLNCSATSVAITYKVKEHTDWCTHQSFIFLWSLFRTYNKSSKPSLFIETDGCITAIEPHFALPSVYAIGTMNGKLLLINTRLSESDNFVMASSINIDQLHRDTITALKWLRTGKKSGRGNIISAALDGKIIVWKVIEAKKEIAAVSIFVILISDLPRALGIKSSVNREAEVGIVSLSLNSEDEDIFVVGCQGGALFQCSLSKTSPARINSKESETLQSCIVLSYFPHRANVTNVHFKQDSRNLFLSCAFDNELRIYSLLESKPIAVFHCEPNLISTKWMPIGTIIASTSENGLISVYNFNENKKQIKALHTFSLEANHKAVMISENYFESNAEIIVTTSAEEVRVIDLKETLCSIEKNI